MNAIINLFALNFYSQAAIYPLPQDRGIADSGNEIKMILVMVMIMAMVIVMVTVTVTVMIMVMIMVMTTLRPNPSSSTNMFAQF